jgi:hypothetical protein
MDAYKVDIALIFPEYKFYEFLVDVLQLRIHGHIAAHLIGSISPQPILLRLRSVTSHANQISESQ